MLGLKDQKRNTGGNPSASSRDHRQNDDPKDVEGGEQGSEMERHDRKTRRGLEDSVGDQVLSGGQERGSEVDQVWRNPLEGTVEERAGVGT